MKYLYYKVTAAASTLPMLMLPSLASAQNNPGGLAGAKTSLGTVGERAGLGGGADGNALPQLIGRGINAILGILGILLVVYLVWAGFLWMTASGNEENVKKAKTMIQQSVIGMVIIISAYAIASFVLNILTSTAGQV